MLLKQLEYFCAVCEHRSFTRAAEACFVSQSAISQQVKALEADLGCALVERCGRGFTLTPAGEHLARRGRALLDDVVTLRYEVEDIVYGRPRALRVGYLNRYDGWEVQGAVGAFARRHPTVEVPVVGASHERLYHLLISGEVDVLFSDRRRALSDEYVNLHLITCYDYLEVSEGNPLAGRDAVGVGDLAGQTCVLVAAPDQQESERSYFRDVRNFPCNFIAAENLEQARFLVAGNRGILPIEGRRAEGPSGSVIRRIPLMGQEEGRGEEAVHLRHDYYAYWPRRNPNPYAAEFGGILAGLFA